MINIGGQTDDDSYRYKMPSLVAKKEGKGNGTKTVFVNISDISKSLNIDPIYPTKFFGIELCSHSSYNKKTDRCIVNGHYSTENLQKILADFIEKFILCDRCNLPETIIRVDKKREMVIKKCAACGIKTKVDPSHKLTTFIVKKPPSYKKLTLKTKKVKEKVKETTKEPETKQPTERDESDSEDWDLLPEREQTEKQSDDFPTPAPVSPSEPPKSASLLQDMLRDGAPSRELLAEVGRMELASPAGKVMGKLLISQGVISALLGDLKVNEALEAVERHSAFLKELMRRDERNPSNLLDAFEDFLSQKRRELMPYAPVLLEKFYDCEVFDEPEILHWFEKEDSSEPVRSQSVSFIRWLKEADEVSE